MLGVYAQRPAVCGVHAPSTLCQPLVAPSSSSGAGVSARRHTGRSTSLGAVQPAAETMTAGVSAHHPFCGAATLQCMYCLLWPYLSVPPLILHTGSTTLRPTQPPASPPVPHPPFSVHSMPQFASLIAQAQVKLPALSIQQALVAPTHPFCIKPVGVPSGLRAPAATAKRWRPPAPGSRSQPVPARFSCLISAVK